MKCACPACGRRTEIEAEVGDFPTRCQRCGALVRPPAEAADAGATPRGRQVPVAGPRGIRLPPAPAGELADLLTVRPPAKPAAAKASPGAAEGPPAAAGDGKAVKAAPELDVAAVRARQKAMRRAQLRVKMGALQAVGAAGLVAAALFGAVALWLGTGVWSQRPRGARAADPQPPAGAAVPQDEPAREAEPRADKTRE